MSNIQTTRKAKWHKFTDEERAEYRKAKNDRKKQLAEYIGNLAPEDREKILEAVGNVVTIDEHRLSEVNTMLCFFQRGGSIEGGKMKVDLSVVGGFAQWKKAGRRIKKGERGMLIWFPCKKKAGSSEGEAETALAVPEQILNKDGSVKVNTYFSTGTVFDISQTAPIAEPDDMPLQIGNDDVIDVEALEA